MLRKKAYFFMVDAVFGLAILILGSFFIYASFLAVPEKTQTTYLADTLMGLLKTTKINTFDNSYYGINGQLWQQGIITNGDNSLLQQIGEFYYYGNNALASDLIRNVTSNIILSGYDYEFWIDDTLLYPLNPSLSHNLSKESSELLLASRSMVFGISNKSSGELFGPYIAEVLVWR